MSIENNQHFRILYLTHAMSSTGAACLASLIEEGYDIVAVVTPTLRYKNNSLIGSVAELVRRRGLAFTALVIFRTLTVKGRATCARFLPLSRKLFGGFQSIDEVGTVHSLRRLYPVDVNSSEFLADAAALRPDLVVIGISDRILKTDFLALFPGRIINIHPAPLPRYRGPDPLYWQLVMDEPRGAISVHYVTPEIDGGNLLEQECFAIESGESESTLKRKVDHVAPRVLVAAIEKVRKGDLGRRQNPADSSYYKHRPKGIAACFPRRSR